MPAGASNLYVRSVGRLGLGSFNVFTLFFTLITTTVVVAPRLDVSIF